MFGGPFEWKGGSCAIFGPAQNRLQAVRCEECGRAVPNLTTMLSLVQAQHRDRKRDDGCR